MTSRSFRSSSVARGPRTVARAAGAAVLAAAALMLVTACGPASAPSSATDEKAPRVPSVVVVTLDTTRADHLGFHGYVRDTSPNLDALAEQSIVFERAYAPMSTTLPSHVSLFTGTYPEEHGVLANVKHGGLKFVPSPKLTAAAEIAEANGWATAGFVSSAPVKRETGVDAGFETFDQPSGYQRPAQETIDPALSWLAEHDRDAPFFLWVHLFDPHNPYRPPVEYRDLFERDQAFEDFLAEREIPDSVFWKGADRDVRRVTDLYDGEIRYMDEQLGRLFDLLEQRGLWDEILLVIAGDHGEGLGQHGELTHGCIHGSQLHVPMLFRGPGTSPRRVDDVVSLVDLLPTAFGETAPEFWEELISQATGRNVLAEEPGLVVSQRTARDRPDIHPFAFTLTTPRHKLVWEPAEGGSTRLFDLESDPHELRDVSRDHPRVVDELRQTLVDEVSRQKDRGQLLRPDAEPEQPFDPERLDQLRSLGYID